MDYLLFLFICIVATLSPGPAVFLVVKNTSIYGVKKAVAGIFGNVSSMMTMAALSSAGLTAVIISSEYLYFALKIAGGSYLIYLGIKYWISGRKSAAISNEVARAKSSTKLYLEAYLVGVTNPKAIVFYTALFPQFINVGQPVIPQFLELSLTFAFLSFVALMFYSLITAKLSSVFNRNGASKIINKIAGTVFVGFGISLFSSHKA